MGIFRSQLPPAQVAAEQPCGPIAFGLSFRPFLCNMKKFLFVVFVAVANLTTQAQSKKFADQPISLTHRQAAETLTGMINSAKSFNKVVDKMLAIQIGHNPSLKMVEPEVRAFLTKYAGWESIHSEVAMVYAHRFSEPELRQIIKFYQTPTGHKLASLLPEITQASMDIGQRRVKEHLPELEKMIKDKTATEYD